jgi:signal transduction histidine kinase
MFVMLSRVLLWLLLGTIIFSLFQKFNPKDGNFVGRLLLAILLIVLVLTFFNPGGTGTVVSPIWQLVSFPLKPLGAAILLMIVAAQRMKGGAIDKPGGFMVGWALTILLIASTPAFAYFLVNPRLAAMLPEGQPKQTLVALTNSVDIAGTSLGSIRSDVPTLFMQSTPSDVSRRGRVALEDFVPNAQTLSQTTSAWESYLNQVFIFLRGR